MKRNICTLLAVLLTVSLAGCAGGETENTEASVPTTAVEETAPATAVTETVPETAAAAAPTEAAYPEILETEILLEGTPEKVTMELFDGGNYVIYIPKGEWIHEAELEDGYLTDSWESIYNENIELELVSYGSLTLEEAEQQILLEEDDYTFQQTEDGYLRGVDYQDMTVMEIRLCSDGKNTFSLMTEYPMEAGEGFGVRIRSMMESFSIK